METKGKRNKKDNSICRIRRENGMKERDGEGREMEGNIETERENGEKGRKERREAVG